MNLITTISLLISFVAILFTIIQALMLRGETRTDNNQNIKDGAVPGSQYWLNLINDSDILFSQKPKQPYVYIRGKLFYCLNPKIKTVIICGRSPTADIAYNDECFHVSKRQFSIFYREGNWFIKDMDSYNGTFLNQKRIVNEEKISVKDIITFGNKTIIVTSTSDKENNDVKDDETNHNP